jgi:hypothetical protein
MKFDEKHRENPVFHQHTLEEVGAKAETDPARATAATRGANFTMVSRVVVEIVAREILVT